MKNNPAIKKAALKLFTSELSQMSSFVSKTLGGKEVYAEPGLAVFELEDGSILELYGPGSVYPEYLFVKSNMVLSYQVHDIQKSKIDAEESGLVSISAIQAVGSCYYFCHLRDQDGNIIELKQQLKKSA